MRAMLALALAAIAVSLQGCVLDIPRHMVGNWEQQESYLKRFAFSIPGPNKSNEVINSCAQVGLATSLQCNGHGLCKRWYGLPPVGSEPQTSRQLSFCFCDRDWAGPECDIQRKSQQTAFMLSLFLGIFGADQFYLGMIRYGIAKFFTLGGLGFWWIYDIVRIGSTPVVAIDSYRVAADVSHWAFVLTLLVFTGVVGFGLSVWSIGRHRKQLAQEIAIMRADCPSFSYGATNMKPAHQFHGHGDTLQGGMYSTPMQRSTFQGVSP